MQNLTTKTIQGYDCRIADISAVGFESLESKEVRYATSNLVGGFFVPFFHQLVGWVQEALSLLGSLLTSLSTCIQSAFSSFESEIGGNTFKRGVAMSAQNNTKNPYINLHQYDERLGMSYEEKIAVRDLILSSDENISAFMNAIAAPKAAS